MAEKKIREIAVGVIITLILILMVSLPVSAANFTTWSSMSGGTTEDINGVWGAASNDVFAVGNAGTILYYDGSAWSSISSGTASDLYGVWGSATNNVFAVGKSGAIIHYNGSIWSSVPSGSTADFYGVWGAASNDVFVVGSSGTIMHYNGSAWSSVSSGTTEDIYSVWGTNGNDIFAVGNSGTILHYDGSTWSSAGSITAIAYHGIWGAASNDVFAVGNSGTILRYDGSTWGSMSSGTTSNLYSVWGTASNDAFAVGSSGTIMHYDGLVWSAMNRNTISELRAIRGFSPADVFAVGRLGTIVRYIPPTITSISPDQGDQGVTLNVTVTGRNLAGASEVRFGTGIAVNSFIALSNQITASITIVTGAETGPRDVSVTTPGGSFTLPDSFTVEQALPTITSISPDQDRQGTTLNVTIAGTHLTGASEIRFGTGIAVNNFTVLSSNQIAASITIAASAEPGVRDVSVTAPGGSFTLSGGFTVNQALPTITSVNPAQGNQETTLNVTVDGTNLTGASEVRFGAGIAVNSFAVLSSDQITANISIALDSETGMRDVSVTTPGGSFTLPTGFTVKQAFPTITSISPSEGSQGATLSVTVAGKNLNGASEVHFGTGIAVNYFTVPSPNQVVASITIVASAEIGVRNVLVTTPGGSFALPNSFTVKQALPTITSISPDYGSQGETLTIIIGGSNLNGATSVSLGSGVAVQSFTNLSPTQIRVNAVIDERAVVGVRDISVTTPGGTSTLSRSFDVKEKSLGILVIAFIWVGVALVVVLFILIFNMLRKKRAARF